MPNYSLRKFNIPLYNSGEMPYDLYSVVKVPSGPASGQYMVSITEDNNQPAIPTGINSSIDGYWINYNDKNLDFSHVWKPTYQSSTEFSPKILNFRFGDGYQQISADGLNHNLNNFEINFNNIHEKESKSILAFLEYKGGTERFYYTPSGPFDAQNTYTCPTWDLTYVGYNTYNIRCNFEESPEREI